MTPVQTGSPQCDSLLPWGVSLSHQVFVASSACHSWTHGLPLPHCPAAPGGAAGAQAPSPDACSALRFPLRLQVDPKRKRNATEQQHYAKLLQLATSAARVLAQRAVEVPRNYILDLPW